MKKIQFSDRDGNRRRSSLLVLRKGGRVYPFAGESIPGVVAVLSRRYVKEGSWSHHVHEIVLAPGVEIAYEGYSGWKTGLVSEAVGASTWAEFASALGVEDTPEFRAVAAVWPRTCEELDRVERDLAALDAPEGGEV